MILSLLIIPAHAQFDPGALDWATVADPHNPDAPDGFAGLSQGIGPRGSVGYTFDITRTEITASQWLPFANAYLPLVEPFDLAVRASISGGVLNISGSAATIAHGLENLPIATSWFTAARFVNWLHNDQIATPQNFETGVYDLTQITFNEDGFFWEGDFTRSADARIALPTLDEWVKAAYYDPEKEGPGQPGYWLHPARQDEVLTAGDPENPGAQRQRPDAPLLPVGSFPDVMSHYGLLDLSGGHDEWTETRLGMAPPRVLGTDYFDVAYFFNDPAFLDRYRNPDSPASGIRLISIVPSPSQASFVLILTVMIPRRRAAYDAKS